MRAKALAENVLIANDSGCGKTFGVSPGLPAGSRGRRVRIWIFRIFGIGSQVRQSRQKIQFRKKYALASEAKTKKLTFFAATETGSPIQNPEKTSKTKNLKKIRADQYGPHVQKIIRKLFLEATARRKPGSRRLGAGLAEDFRKTKKLKKIRTRIRAENEKTEKFSPRPALSPALTPAGQRPARYNRNHFPDSAEAKQKTRSAGSSRGKINRAGLLLC